MKKELLLFYFYFYLFCLSTTLIRGTVINCEVINYELDKWKTINNYIRFEVLEAFIIKIMVSRNMTPCNMTDG
jgi:hypothetical protein